MTVGMKKKYQGTVSEKMFNIMSVTSCVEIWKCGKPRVCGWEGLHLHLIEGQESKHGTPLVCPECGHDEFEVEYIPKYKAHDLYTIK